jgi:dTDP-4-dehydrorhamnose reductase
MQPGRMRDSIPSREKTGEANMKVAITGARGLFGYGLAEVFRARHSITDLRHQDADITRPEELRAVFAKIRPEVVIHPAAIPDLDICEADPDRAFLVNVTGTRNVADAAREVGAALAYISTDAVFDGKKRMPYTESDPTLPVTVYGRTKLMAEGIVREAAEHWVFRVSVLFGPGKANFVEKGLNKIAAGEDWVVAADQLGSATYTLDAAEKIREVVEARRHGLYHLANQGACTRLELARCAAELARLDAGRIVGKPSREMGRRAVRLEYAVMEMRALQQAGFAPPRPWQDALEEYIRTLQLPARKD